MAISILPKEDSNTNADDKHLQLFCLISPDANIDVQGTEDAEQE